MCVSVREEEREEEGRSGAALKTKTPHVNVGKKQLKGEVHRFHE